MKRLFYLMVFIVLVAGSGLSCSESIPECPTPFCILAGGWQLVSITEDGVTSTVDLSKYELTLTLPNAKEAKGTFLRTNTVGVQDQGDWEIKNDLPQITTKELTLTPASSPEEPYSIESLSPRKMVLVINRDNGKTGPTQIEYIFIPL